MTNIIDKPEVVLKIKSALQEFMRLDAKRTPGIWYNQMLGSVTSRTENGETVFVADTRLLEIKYDDGAPARDIYNNAQINADADFISFATQLATVAGDLLSLLDNLHARAERYRLALEFYAREGRPGTIIGEFDGLPLIQDDNGEVATLALQEPPHSEGEG